MISLRSLDETGPDLLKNAARSADRPLQAVAESLQQPVRNETNMRRKSDMWQEFLPAEVEQEAKDAAADARDRIEKLEEQLKSQFTSMATYAQIAQQSIDTARAEARADLEREKSTVISLIERVRTELLDEEHRPVPVQPGVEPDAESEATSAPPAVPSIDISALARIALLEDKFERLTYQFGQVLKSQEELANSIAFMFEQQLRNSGWMTGEAVLSQ